MADSLSILLSFLSHLRLLGLPHRVSQSRESCITVEVFPLRERWEIDFFEDGSVEADQFVPLGDPIGVSDLAALVKRLSSGEGDAL